VSSGTIAVATEPAVALLISGSTCAWILASSAVITGPIAASSGSSLAVGFWPLKICTK